MAKFSTGLRNGILGAGSFKSQIDGAYLKIYSGAIPATADDALGAAVLICTLTIGGLGATGLTFASPAVAGVIAKTTAESWAGTNVATGTASFFRLAPSGDTGTLSTTAVRVQGSIGPVGTDMLMASTAMTAAQPFTLSYFNVTLPTL